MVTDVFHFVPLITGGQAGSPRVAVPLGGGRQLLYGTDDGVFLSDLQSQSSIKFLVKLLPLPDVTCLDALEYHDLLFVLSGG